MCSSAFTMSFYFPNQAAGLPFISSSPSNLSNFHPHPNHHDSLRPRSPIPQNSFENPSLLLDTQVEGYHHDDFTGYLPADPMPIRNYFDGNPNWFYPDFSFDNHSAIENLFCPDSFTQLPSSLFSGVPLPPGPEDRHSFSTMSSWSSTSLPEYVDALPPISTPNLSFNNQPSPLDHLVSQPSTFNGNIIPTSHPTVSESGAPPPQTRRVKKRSQRTSHVILAESSASITQGGYPRKYACTWEDCGKAFTTSGHLVRHKRIHTGEKRYECVMEGCKSRFSRQDNMLQHYRTHLSSKSRRSTTSASCRSTLGQWKSQVPENNIAHNLVHHDLGIH